MSSINNLFQRCVESLDSTKSPIQPTDQVSQTDTFLTPKLLEGHSKEELEQLKQRLNAGMEEIIQLITKEDSYTPKINSAIERGYHFVSVFDYDLNTKQRFHESTLTFLLKNTALIQKLREYFHPFDVRTIKTGTLLRVNIYWGKNNGSMDSAAPTHAESPQNTVRRAPRPQNTYVPRRTYNNQRPDYNNQRNDYQNQRTVAPPPIPQLQAMTYIPGPHTVQASHHVPMPVYAPQYQQVQIPMYAQGQPQQGYYPRPPRYPAQNQNRRGGASNRGGYRQNMNDYPAPQ